MVYIYYYLGIPHYLRQTEDVAEVLNHCASSNWSERKEGLLGLQNLLKNQRILRWVRGQGGGSFGSHVIVCVLLL